MKMPAGRSRCSGRSIMPPEGENMSAACLASISIRRWKDIYNPSTDIPDGFTVKTVPAFTWAVFPCRGALPDALQDINAKIFSEWLPALQDYELAAGYSVEMYEAPDKYPKGTADENYYTEIWIPVRKK